MSIPFFHIDAFADRLFAGNPAAVCILNAHQEEGWMQQVAQEMNLPATAFLQRQDDGWNLRWFSPAVELALCGHGTLASAHALREYVGPGGNETIHFTTRAGLLTASYKGEWIELNFPAISTEPVEVKQDVIDALGAAPQFAGRGNLDLLVEVQSEDVVRDLKPDLDALKAATPGVRGIIVTSRAEGQAYDFVSRFFAPSTGIAEDPVTGSAHCCLGPFWSGRLGKSELVGYQASKRGGTVRVRLDGERAYLSGQAITLVQGEIQI